MHIVVSVAENPAADQRRLPRLSPYPVHMKYLLSCANICSCQHLLWRSYSLLLEGTAHRLVSIGLME